MNTHGNPDVNLILATDTRIKINLITQERDELQGKLAAAEQREKEFRRELSDHKAALQNATVLLASAEQRVKELEKDMAQCDSDRQTNGKIADDAIGRLHATIERERVLREAVTRISELKDFISGGHARNIAKEALAATGKEGEK